MLGGAIIPEEKHYWVNKHLDTLASSICAHEPLAVEFHACEIFSAKKDPWKNMAGKQARIETIKSVLDVVNRERLFTIACAIEKKYYENEDIVNIAFEDLISRFQSHLSRIHRETGEATRGMIVFDKSAYESDLQSLALRFRGEGTRYRSITAIQEVPLFVDSRSSRAIQLADHIAYAVFRRYNAEDLSYFNVIQSQFDTHGLFHMTKDFRNCTCPACLRPRLQPSAQDLSLPTN